MLGGIKRFVSRNRRKFVIVGVAIGGTYLAARYVKQKIIEWQETNARDYIEKTRRLQHFGSAEQTCNEAIVSLSTNIRDELLKVLNTDIILEKLRCNGVENKVELWDNLKIVAFTRMATMIYATTILVITLRVQMNILGGYLYKDTVLPDAKKISNDIRQSYLLLVQQFINSGHRDLAKLIENKVRMVLETYSFTMKLTLSDIEQIFWSIQMAINSDSMEPNSNLARYVLPPAIDGDNEMLQKMYYETLDVLESDDVTVLSANSVSRAFSIAIDNVAEYFCDATKTTENNSSRNGKSALEEIAGPVHTLNINNVTLPLAKVIPVLCKITDKNESVNLNGKNLGKSLIMFLLTSEKIKTLGANVYESFSI